MVKSALLMRARVPAGLATSTETPLKDKLFVVIGAGGAGKALAYGAKERRARVVVANRNFGTRA